MFTISIFNFYENKPFFNQYKQTVIKLPDVHSDSTYLQKYIHHDLDTRVEDISSYFFDISEGPIQRDISYIF